MSNAKVWRTKQQTTKHIGYPELIAFRDVVIRELKERFGVRAIAQAPPKYNSASAGMVEHANKQVKVRKCEPW